MYVDKISKSVMIVHHTRILSTWLGSAETHYLFCSFICNVVVSMDNLNWFDSRVKLLGSLLAATRKRTIVCVYISIASI